MLNTARFRSLIGELIEVDSQHIHAYVIGEQGDSEVLTWSTVTVGGVPLKKYCAIKKIHFDQAVRKDIDNRVRKAAYKIIEGKGATYYDIGSALAKLVDVIIHDQRSILTVFTSNVESIGYSAIAMSIPHLLGGSGGL